MNDSEAGPSTWAPEYFDVFLNHRGPDTKATFVAHLDEALRLEGFQPFLDRLSLIVGNRNDESIYRALDMAKVHVVVVSEGYAESVYCLDELVAIKKSHKPVIPVFYGVEPSDLRWVKGKFAKAFENHEKRQTSQEKLQEWRDALEWLAGRVGCRFDTTSRDRDEARLKQDVVNAVKDNFPQSSGFVDENHRVGLEESRKEVVRKLESQGPIGVVGLYGMGGIGKTTLATTVYEYCSQDFQHCSFLRDVRSSDRLTLQKQIIKDLHLGTKVNSREEYKREFHKFKSLKVLIVVDDIDDERQFQDIIPNLDTIGGGSKIIVTSRNRRLLSNVLISMPRHDMVEAERSVLHEVEQLSKMESQQLFNFHAFPSKSPDNGFEDLAVKVANACGGHPLALEIAGAFLRNKKNLETDRVFWDEMITSKATRDDKLQSILRISYNNGLDNCQKTMFLDISCHLIGEPSAIALEMWASCEYCDCGIRSGVHSSLRDLIEKCLVKVDMDDHLQMHDVLRDMGRDIDGELPRSERTHLWGPEAANVVLEGRKPKSDKVRGFSIARQDRVDDLSILTFGAEALSEMSELHLLVLDGCFIFGDFSNWSRELRLLQWRSFPLSELPSELNLVKTAVVDLSNSSKLTRLWEDNSMVSTGSPKVKRRKKDKTPPRKASKMICMEWRQLLLNGCIMLTILPQNIGKQLTMLKVLDLSACYALESLPNSIGEMRDLEKLILSWCMKLRSIPKSVGGLKKLKVLELGYCYELESLPDSIGEMTDLEKLILNHCEKLQSIPETFGGLKKLKVLELDSCYGLESLPDSIGEMTDLEQLILSDCNKLQSIPETFGGLKKLKVLELDSCYGLESLPDSIGEMTDLEQLILSDCNKLQSIPETVGGLKKLKVLNVGTCCELESLPDSIGEMRDLEQLILICCEKLRSIPETFGGLKKLKVLDLSACYALESLPNSIGEMRDLEKLILSWCTKLRSIPKSVGGLKKLKVLNLDDCYGLESLPDSIGEMRDLEKLILNHCEKLQSIPETFGGLKKLKVLNLGDCYGLESLPDSIGEMRDLEKLILSWCTKLRSIPKSVGGLKKLKVLNLDDCYGLESLPDSIGEMRDLEQLILRYCKKLRSIPETVGGLKKLKVLNLVFCYELESLPGSIGEMRDLEQLLLR